MKAAITAATIVTLLALAAEARLPQDPFYSQSVASTKKSDARQAQEVNGPWRTRDLIDTPVYDMAGHQVGDVEDFILDESGRPGAIIIATGGFLGIGTKDVVLPLAHAKRVLHDDGKSYFTLDASWNATEVAGPFRTIVRSRL